MSQTKLDRLISILSLLATVVFVGGCRSSNQATDNEGFFEPLTSVNRPALQKPSDSVVAQKPLSWDEVIESLLARQREQERRIGVLTGQLQLLEMYRKGDSSTVARKQPDRVSRPDVQPFTSKYEEILRQYNAGEYKTALEGFRGLLQSGVPKDAEDQVHYMIGMSRFKMRQFDLASASLKIVANWKGSGLRADAYFVLGQIYKELGASRQARTSFETALRESTRAALAEAARNELIGLPAKK